MTGTTWLCGYTMAAEYTVVPVHTRAGARITAVAMPEFIMTVTGLPFTVY